MSADLSNEANELVRAGQQALRPTAGDKQRVLAALQARVQQDPGTKLKHHLRAARNARLKHPGRMGAYPLTPEATSQRLKLMTLGNFALVAGGLIASYAVVAQYMSRADNEAGAPSAVAPSVGAPSAVPAESQTAKAPALPQPATSELEEWPSGESMPATARSIGRSPAGDSLAAEAAVLSRAEKALHAGGLNRALLLTNEHRGKFPKGLMVQERVNIQVQALCGLGREGEADKVYARLRRMESVPPGQACRQK